LKYDDKAELVVSQAEVGGAYVIRADESSINELVELTLKHARAVPSVYDLLGRKGKEL
jgi:hypothetical protein